MAALKYRVFKGFIWASIGSVGAGSINLLFFMILARFVDPIDFGLFEIIVLITSFSSIFVDSGFSQALIRDRDATAVDLSTVFIFNVLISVLVYIMLILALPYLLCFFNAKEIYYGTIVALGVIVVDAFGLVQNVKLTKKLQFKEISIASLLGIILGGLSGLFFATNGYGLWSLISMIVVNSIVKTLYLWIKGDNDIVLCFRMKRLKKYFNFGFFVFVQSFLDKLLMNMETIFVGKFYTKTQLGFFSQSRKVDSYFGQALTNVVVKVSFPALVQLNTSDEKLKTGYKKIIELTTFVICPFMLLMLFFPHLIMNVLFGEKWIAAGDLLRLWAIFGLVHPIQSICNNIFYVKGEGKIMFRITIIRQALKFLALALFVGMGLEIMLLSVIITSIISMIIYVYNSGKLINYSLGEIIKDVSPNIITASVMAYIILLFNNYVHFTDIYIMLISDVVLMFSGYFVVSYVLKFNGAREIVTLLKNRR